MTGRAVNHSLRILAYRTLLLTVGVHLYHTQNPTLIAGLTAGMPKRKREVQVIGQAVHFGHIGGIETDRNRPQRVVREEQYIANLRQGLDWLSIETITVASIVDT